MFQSTKKVLLSSLAVAASVVMLSSNVSAGVISTLPQPFRCLCAPNGLGQSFTAEDSFVSLTVSASDANQHLNPGVWSIALEFLEGDGPGGAVLDTFTFTPDGFQLQEFTFDLSHIALTIGQHYSYILTATGGRGTTGRTSSDVYAGGRAFLADTGASFGELGFRVTPVAAPEPPTGVPAPGALALLGLGLIGLSARRRAA